MPNEGQDEKSQFARAQCRDGGPDGMSQFARAQCRDGGPDEMSQFARAQCRDVCSGVKGGEPVLDLFPFSGDPKVSWEKG